MVGGYVLPWSPHLNFCSLACLLEWCVLCLQEAAGLQSLLSDIGKCARGEWCTLGQALHLDKDGGCPSFRAACPMQPPALCGLLLADSLPWLHWH